MPNANTTRTRRAEIARLDGRTARFVTVLQPDAADLVARVIVERAEHVEVSPQIAGLMLDLSAPTVRKAADSGNLHARGRHRWIRLSDLGAWVGAPISAEQVEHALLIAVAESTDREFHEALRVVGDAAQFRDTKPSTGPQALAAGLQTVQARLPR